METSSSRLAGRILRRSIGQRTQSRREKGKKDPKSVRAYPVSRRESSKKKSENSEYKTTTWICLRQKKGDEGKKGPRGRKPGLELATERRGQIGLEKNGSFGMEKKPWTGLFNRLKKTGNTELRGKICGAVDVRKNLKPGEPRLRFLS